MPNSNKSAIGAWPRLAYKKMLFPSTFSINVFLVFIIGGSCRKSPDIMSLFLESDDAKWTIGRVAVEASSIIKFSHLPIFEGTKNIRVNVAPTTSASFNIISERSFNFVRNFLIIELSSFNLFSIVFFFTSSWTKFKPSVNSKNLPLVFLLETSCSSKSISKSRSRFLFFLAACNLGVRTASSYSSVLRDLPKIDFIIPLETMEVISSLSVLLSEFKASNCKFVNESCERLAFFCLSKLSICSCQ